MIQINEYETPWNDIDLKIWECVRRDSNGNWRDNAWNNVGDIVRINIYMNTVINVKNSVTDNFLKPVPSDRQLSDAYKILKASNE